MEDRPDARQVARLCHQENYPQAIHNSAHSAEGMLLLQWRLAMPLMPDGNSLRRLQSLGCDDSDA